MSVSPVDPPLDQPREASPERGRARRASMHLACPECGRQYVIAVPGAAGRGGGDDTSATGDRRGRFFACEACGFPIQFEAPLPDPSRPLARCAFCGNREFYVQKDFNRTLGVWLVVASAMIALLVMVLVDHRVGLGVLLAVTIVDAIVFRLVPSVTVCYLCHAIYRGFPARAEDEPFDLEHEERYKRLRQEWIRRTRQEE